MFNYKKNTNHIRYAKLLNERERKARARNFKEKYQYDKQTKSYFLGDDFTTVHKKIDYGQGVYIASSRVADEELIREVQEKLELLSNYTYTMISIKDLSYTEAVSIVSGKYHDIIMDMMNTYENIERGLDAGKYGHIQYFAKEFTKSNKVQIMFKEIGNFMKKAKSQIDMWGNTYQYELNYVYYGEINK